MNTYIARALFFSLLSVFCNANATIKYTYDESKSEIRADVDGNIKKIYFSEFSKSNFSGSFKFVGESPAVVYDNNSMMNYSTQVILKYKKNEFVIDCVSLDIRSGYNGVYAKEGVCGLDKPVSGDFSKYEDYVYSIVNQYLDRVNFIDTTYYRDELVNKLPIILVRNKEHYIYKFYASVDDLINGEYTIRECFKSDPCKDYKQQPWIITNSGDAGKVTLLQDKIVKNQYSLIPAVASAAVDNSKFTPFTIAADRVYFYSDDYQKRKAYLIKDDKVNLVSMTDDKVWCRVQYFNESNKSIVGNIRCEELNK